MITEFIIYNEHIFFDNTIVIIIYNAGCEK